MKFLSKIQDVKQTCTHIRLHMRSFTCVCVCHACVCTCAYPHVCIHSCVYAGVDTCADTRVSKHVRLHSRVSLHVRIIPVCVYVRIRACYTCLCMFVGINTNTCAITRMLVPRRMSPILGAGRRRALTHRECAHVCLHTRSHRASPGVEDSAGREWPGRAVSRACTCPARGRPAGWKGRGAGQAQWAAAAGLGVGCRVGGKPTVC